MKLSYESQEESLVALRLELSVSKRKKGVF